MPRAYDAAHLLPIHHDAHRNGLAVSNSDHVMLAGAFGGDIATLARCGGGRAPLQARTLAARAAAIGFWFSCRGEPRPGGPQLPLLLTSFKLAHGDGGGRAKVPFSIAALRWAVRRARAHGSTRARALAAVLLVQFFSCCRVGEICANDDGKSGKHIIRRQDVILLTARAKAVTLAAAEERPAAVAGASLFFRGSKVDKFRIGATRAH